MQNIIMQDIMEFVRSNLFLSMGWLVLTLVIIYITVKMAFSKVKMVDRTQATLLINKQDALLLDIRPKAEYQKGHIANAVNLSADDIAKGNLGALTKDHNRPIIVACAYGLTPSHTAAEQLIKQGFSNVYYLKSGIDGWQANHLPLVR